MCRIAAGATQLDAEDWESGEPVSIQLDADASPSEQAEGLYRRARKLRRAVDAVAPLLEAAQQEVEYLETVRVALLGWAGLRLHWCMLLLARV